MALPPSVEAGLSALARAFPHFAIWLPLVKSKTVGVINRLRKMPLGVRTVVATGLRALADELER